MIMALMCLGKIRYRKLSEANYNLLASIDRRCDLFINIMNICILSVLLLCGKLYTNYTVFQKKTPTCIIGYKLRNSCLILIIFDIKIPHII